MKTTRITLLVVFMLCTVFLTSAFAAQKVAIVPFVNSTTETREIVATTVSDKFNEKFNNENYVIVPEAEVTAALATAGYDPKNLELADKSVLASVARQTGADVVIAMDIESFKNWRSYGLWWFVYTSSTAKSDVKLQFHTYNADNGRYASFESVALGKNAAYFYPIFNSGMSRAIADGVSQAMDAGFANFSF
jgi:TPP-dependent trihydroxycyclohexane-1,2-dione (THcHDO) dehydratase